MGRLNKSVINDRANISVNYKKLIDELNGNFDCVKIMPSLQEYVTYSCHNCGHSQKLQIEELNTIIGNAFRKAYTAQLQKQTSIASQMDSTQNKLIWAKDMSSSILSDKQSHFSTKLDSQSLKTIEPRTKNPRNMKTNQTRIEQQCSSSSDELNTTAEMNSIKKMTEKPPLMKRITIGLNPSNQSDEDTSPLVHYNNNIRPGSLSYRSHSDEYVSNNRTNVLYSFKNDLAIPTTSKLDNNLRLSSANSSSTDSNIRIPSPPERIDSLDVRDELRSASWFQAGIPREIVLEILAQEPNGAFIVRESTSKPGCFALSLRVPRSYQPSGIAHYLILKTSRGYKIKGFTKEFTTIISLITHHSVMPELLPCPLSLSKYTPAMAKPDSKKDFADINQPEYNTFTDFRNMMADLKV